MALHNRDPDMVKCIDIFEMYYTDHIEGKKIECRRRLRQPIAEASWSGTADHYSVSPW